jgi:hypothetical protein
MVIFYLFSDLHFQKASRFDIFISILYPKGMAEEWITLLITYDQLEAEMIKDLLESGDISVVLRSAKITPYPVNIGKMGEVKIMVRETDREAAEEMLRKLGEEAESPDEDED